MPIGWPQWVVPNVNHDGSPVTPLNPQHWICNGGPPWDYPFAGTPADGTGWFLAYTTTPSNPAVAPVMWIVGKNKSSLLNQGANFDFPSQTLTDDMNDSFYGNLLLQAQFWTREFDPQPLSKASYFLEGCTY